MRGHFAAVVLIVVGTFWLLTNLGVINVSLADIFRTWWPVLLIGLGVAMIFTPNSKK